MAEKLNYLKEIWWKRLEREEVSTVGCPLKLKLPPTNEEDKWSIKYFCITMMNNSVPFSPIIKFFVYLIK